MHSALRRFSILCILFLAVTFAHAAPVLMISIDGMKPEYITHADEHGLKIPFLRTLVSQGTYAEGVTGVVPTITYPSHTTLVTGVWPAEHGILSNGEFDPEQKLNSGWYWYASQIRVPTLWSAARAAGLHTASIGWPVTVGADIDYLIPEYWRGPNPSGSVDPADRFMMAALAKPTNLILQIEPSAGPYMMGNYTEIAGDEVKTKYSIEILRRYKPDFMTIHLSSLDENEHEHSPFSAEACATMEALDGMVARLWKQAQASNPAAVLVVVSDHGFLTITHSVNLLIPFVDAGLIQIAPGAKTVSSWKAVPWLEGGLAPVILHDSNDNETRQKVRDLLAKLAADPENHIAEVLNHDEVVKRGGFPDAAFLVVFKQGYTTGTATSGPLITPIQGAKGTHGFSPEFPEMRSSFFAMGSSVAQHRNLGQIDMRQIAPTAAKILHVSLPTAKAAPLHVEP